MPHELTSIEIAGRIVRYICRGTGTPTVIIDQGQGLSIERGFSNPTPAGWANVFGEILKATRVVMHDRAGLGWSDVSPSPRTSAEMVEDLRAILREANIAPPYVLVGHSIGGFNVRFFASRYPNEVVGMVLVESCHPDQWSRIAQELPAESVDESPILRAVRRVPAPSFSPEAIDLLSSAEQVRKTGTLGTKPLVVLTQSPRALRPPGIPVKISDKMRAVWHDLQLDLLSLSANSSHVIANHAGHNIQLDEPQLVIDAILKIVQESRSGERSIH
jgi:pimeloyl-ACP methyl ester carboxylesterase